MTLDYTTHPAELVIAGVCIPSYLQISGYQTKRTASQLNCQIRRLTWCNPCILLQAFISTIVLVSFPWCDAWCYHDDRCIHLYSSNRKPHCTIFHLGYIWLLWRPGYDGHLGLQTHIAPFSDTEQINRSLDTNVDIWPFLCLAAFMILSDLYCILLYWLPISLGNPATEGITSIQIT